MSRLSGLIVTNFGQQPGFLTFVVLALTKLRQATWPRFIDVRLNAFGLYLVHPLCIFLLCHAFDVIYRFVMNASPGSLLQNSVQFWACLPVAVGMWATMFVLCYGMSLVIAQMLVARSALSWMVG